MSYVYRSSEQVTFHEATTAAKRGNLYYVKDMATLTVEIYGTSTSRTVEFKAISASGTERAISGIKLDGLTVANQTTGNNEIWTFDISGLYKVIMDVTAVAGGNISIKGKVVA